MAPVLPLILCVDDEPAVLDGIMLTLRRRFQVLTAPSGKVALEMIEQHREKLAVVMSDMRMPNMDGATLLTQVRARCPDVVRILLTGHADLTAAISAVNDGQIYRFLTKPCLPLTLIAALESAVEHRRLVNAERELLEQTLHGSVKALVEVLAMTSPAAFGRATLVKECANTIMTELGLTERWQVEVAAMLAPLGSMTWPNETAERVSAGKPLTPDDQRMVEQAPAITDQLLQHIPRLEVVREILLGVGKAPKISATPLAQRTVTEVGVHVLRVATDLIAIEARGESRSAAVDLIRSREGRYDLGVLAALEKMRGAAVAGGDEVRELPLALLRVGMVFAEDVRMVSGTLLVAKGSAITFAFLERMKNFQLDAVAKQFRVIVKTSPPSASVAA
jgi:CheY-like chemotaxis protein